jgi:hypothetical protein
MKGGRAAGAESGSWLRWILRAGSFGRFAQPVARPRNPAEPGPPAVLVAAVVLALSACGHSPALPAAKRHPLHPLPAGTLPWVGRVAIDWKRGDRPREHILIGPGGLELGAADGPLTRYLFNRRGRSEDLRGFVRSFGPFTLRAKGEELAFHGAGPAPASPAERRMIATWAHLVVAEAVAGRGGTAYAAVLSWHRSADAGGECDEVRVDLTGEVRAGPCGRPNIPANTPAGSPGGDWQGRLADDQLRRLYLWCDAWAPFQGGTEEDQPGAPPVRLIFAGRGKAAPSAAERAAVAAFAANLYRELAARHPAPAAPAPAAAPQLTGKQPGKPAGKPAAKSSPPPATLAPEPAGAHVLRPEVPPTTVVPPVAAPPAPPPPPATPGDKSPG